MVEVDCASTCQFINPVLVFAATSNEPPIDLTGDSERAATTNQSKQQGARLGKRTNEWELDENEDPEEEDEEAEEQDEEQEEKDEAEEAEDEEEEDDQKKEEKGVEEEAEEEAEEEVEEEAKEKEEENSADEDDEDPVGQTPAGSHTSALARQTDKEEESTDEDDRPLFAPSSKKAATVRQADAGKEHDGSETYDEELEEERQAHKPTQSADSTGGVRDIPLTTKSCFLLHA
jgi:hypothetical protein